MSNNPFKRKKQTPLYTVEVGGFLVRFYFKENSIVDSYMEIRTISDNWRMRLDARHEAYGYLVAAAQQGNNEQIHGYCFMLYSIAVGMTQDQGFTDDITKAIKKYIKRLDKQSETEAKNVSEAQIAGDEALMNEAIERGNLQGNKKAEKKASKESRKEIKKVLEEDNFNEKVG